jgi:ribose/xylose/arabinose/galactoside ABC-type transport system permease subunit
VTTDVKPHRRTRYRPDLATLGPIVALTVLFLVFAVASPTFLTGANLVGILRQISIVGILAVGMTFVIILGEIDLSLGAILTMSGLLGAALSIGAYGIPFTLSPWIAVFIAVAFGAAVGLLSGYAAARWSIPSFIGTLAVTYALVGLKQWFTKAQSLGGLPSELTFLGGGTVLGFPVIAIVFAAVFTAGHIVLRYTVFGANLYAIGGNRATAQFSGISVSGHRITAFVIAGALAAFAGIVMLGRLGSAQVTAGDDLQLAPIAAVILGGSSLFGGVGTMLNTLVGVVLLGVLQNGLNHLGVAADGQNIVTGVVLFVAIALGAAARRATNR